ncbi:arylsulfatase (plasmid) [Fulvitalea axinellae]|uniref:Arylsulfatase n=1 Tax=Fulvitalea axinellae TaxID=1182444 RepID=A0AAU9CKL1_9BACT|nr:arylsulfatase [Fulvitalea axinellae]
MKKTFLAALLLCFGFGANAKKKKLERPNIVLILVDDLGKEWVSCYGAQGINTPNVDALAEQGKRFSNAYSMPQCTPSRVTLLTGQYPFRHGWINHWDVPRWGGGAHYDERKNPSLAKALKRAGYATAVAGKWQIDDFRVEPEAMVKSGFDEFFMWTGYEAGNPPSSKRYQDPYVFGQGVSGTQKGKFGPDLYSGFIIDFIKKNKEKPFFAYFPMALTHSPFVDTPDEKADSKLGKHKSMVRYADKLTGNVLKALEDAGVRENTVVIWTADNGTSGSIVGQLNGRAVRGGKAKTIEAGICMPFIVSWPARMSPGVTETLVDFSDIYPTLLELAGARRQKGYVIDGRSFAKVLKGEAKDGPRSWILGMGGKNQAKLTDKGVENRFRYRDRVLRNKRYKLCIGTDRKAKAFYDLREDPWEERNLIDNLGVETGRRKSFEALMAVVKTFPEQDSDPSYLPNPKRPWDVEVKAKSQIWKE